MLGGDLERVVDGGEDVAGVEEEDRPLQLPRLRAPWASNPQAAAQKWNRCQVRFVENERTTLDFERMAAIRLTGGAGGLQLLHGGGGEKMRRRSVAPRLRGPERPVYQPRDQVFWHTALLDIELNRFY